MTKKSPIKDMDLWWDVVKSVDPMHPIKPAKFDPDAIKFSPKKKPTGMSVTVHKPKTAPPVQGPYQFDKQLVRNIKKGKHQPQRTLDLHGHSLASAHPILLRFLRNAQKDDCRLVLVITGKGRTHQPGAELGALRRSVPLWMSAYDFRAIVHSFTTATPRLGGEGAYLIKLKKPQALRSGK